MNRKILIVCMVAMLILSGCGMKSVFINEPTEQEFETIGFVIEEYEIEKRNPEYYSQIANIRPAKNKPELLRKYGLCNDYKNMGLALAWKIDHNDDTKNEKIHVVLGYKGYGTSYSCSDDMLDEKIEEISKVIDNINTESGMQIEFDSWFSVFLTDFYALLTEEEIIRLSQEGCFLIDYVGSNEVEHDGVDFNTPEGVDIFIEMYGDSFVQCIDGKELVDYTK